MQINWSIPCNLISSGLYFYLEDSQGYILEICIIGLPKSGKTTIFNALTKGKVDAAHHAKAAMTPNFGVSKIPEPRFQVLDRIFHPKKIES